MGAILMLCAAVPLAVFAIAPRTVVAVFYGAQYLQAAPLLFALGTAVFVQYASYLTAQVLVSRGQTIAVWAFAAVGTIEAVAIGVHHVSLTGVATILVTTRLTGAAFIGSSAWIMRRTTLVDEVS
jgi:O-antigen/teichoic acid export membrane protein